MQLLSCGVFADSPLDTRALRLRPVRPCGFCRLRRKLQKRPLPRNRQIGSFGSVAALQRPSFVIDWRLRWAALFRRSP